MIIVLCLNFLKCLRVLVIQVKYLKMKWHEASNLLKYSWGVWVWIRENRYVTYLQLLKLSNGWVEFIEMFCWVFKKCFTPQKKKMFYPSLCMLTVSIIQSAKRRDVDCDNLFLSTHTPLPEIWHKYIHKSNIKKLFTRMYEDSLKYPSDS